MAWSVTIYFTEQGQMFWVVFCLAVNRRIWLKQLD